MEVRKRRNKENVQSKSFKKRVLKEEQKSFYSACCCLSTFATIPILSVAIFVVFYPTPIEPEYYTLGPRPEFSGALEPNNVLETNSERLFEHQLVGPESLVSYGEFIYTGTFDKGVLQINKETGVVSQLPPLGQLPCGTRDLETSCGRPLGLRVSDGFFLYVIDAYLGIFKYDLRDISKPALKIYEGVVFGNDLAIASNGIIYFTDSSSRWQRKNFMYLVLEAAANGKLLKLNETSKEVTVLSNKLNFANGIELSKDEDYILVAELNRARIARLWLKGPKKGTWDYFAENLPGTPDNIRRTSRNTYWVGFAIVRHGGINTYSVEYGGRWPFIRKAISKFYSVLPNFVISMLPKYGLIVEFNESGQAIRSFHDPSALYVPRVSEVVESGTDELYLGSFSNPFLTKVNIPQA